MFRRLLLVVLPVLMLLAAPSAEAGRKHPLALPEPIAVPADLEQGQIVRAIKAALLGRTWTITGEQPGRIEATLHLREHSATIYVDYDRESIRFHHVASSNLMEGRNRRGELVIHRNYNSWLQNVANDLRIQLDLARL